MYRLTPRVPVGRPYTDAHARAHVTRAHTLQCMPPPNLLGCSVARPSLEHSSSTTTTLTMLNRNMSRITLILALACSASAFMVPAKVSKVPAKVLKLPATVRFSMMASSTKESSSTEESTKNMPKPAYPGIEMPFDTGSTSENSMGNVNLEVNKFLAEGLAEWVEILAKGTLKKDPEGFDGLQHIVTKNSNHAKKLPQGYKHFGGEDYAAQLCVILETNPFYASSLTPRAGGGFEIINYDPDGKTYSSRVMRTIGRPGPRVNVKFSVKPEGGLAIDGFDVYVSPAGDDKYYVVPDEREDDNYYASAVLYDLLFVSETLHATVRTALTLDPKSSIILTLTLTLTRCTCSTMCLPMRSCTPPIMLSSNSSRSGLINTTPT